VGYTVEKMIKERWLGTNVTAYLGPVCFGFWQLLATKSFWPPKAVVDCQTLSFSVSFYKIR
jgi:hypothetical protein